MWSLIAGICKRSWQLHLPVNGQFRWKLHSSDHRLLWGKLEFQFNVYFHFSRKLFFWTFSASLSVTFTVCESSPMTLNWWLAVDPICIGCYAGSSSAPLQCYRFSSRRSWIWSITARITQHGWRNLDELRSRNGHTGVFSQQSRLSVWLSYGFLSWRSADYSVSESLRILILLTSQWMNCGMLTELFHMNQLNLNRWCSASDQTAPKECVVQHSSQILKLFYRRTSKFPYQFNLN